MMRSAIVLAAVLSIGCSTTDTSKRTTASDSPAGSPRRADGSTPARVVIVIADDLGVDALSIYADVNGVDASDRPYPATPTIDRLCSEGVRFTRAWAMPTCTPTRGSILTGRYGFRTGLDGVGKQKQIRTDEVTLPRVLEDLADTANIGKWHLGEDESIGGLRAPNEMGWDHYAGSISNLEGYFEFTKVVDGTSEAVKNYATTETVDDALAWTKARPEDASWLLWVAFNAPHTPFHLPPDELHQQGGTTDPAEQYDAAIEAIDTELGRLLASLPKDVTVIVLGDNGSPARAVRAPLDRRHAKGTLYEGGVHVPLCIAGPEVSEPGRSESALVSSVDLFATAATLMGADELPTGVGQDSVSLTPYLAGKAPAQRSIVYTEQNRTHERQKNGKNAGGRAIRNERFKLLVFEDGTSALYDLKADPTETRDLSQSSDADATAANKALHTALDAL